MFQSIINMFSTFTEFLNFPGMLLYILDIIIVAILIYNVIKIIRATSAEQVFKGLGFVLIIAVICVALNLETMVWLLSNLTPVAITAFIIIFQPEVRKALEKMGRGNLFNREKTSEDYDVNVNTKKSIITAVLNLARQKTGALIVIAQNTNLGDIIENGIKLNADISSQLIENIFFPNTPLHDGAIIINKNTIVAAACFLPLSHNPKLQKDLGTRHRAGIGMSEQSDALILIVSEETGIISYCFEEKLVRNIKEKELDALLTPLYPKTEVTQSIFVNTRKGEHK